MGGRIRYFVSGGAPLNIEVKHFLVVVFSAPIFEAYGQTETAGIISATQIWDREGGHVGGVLPCNRMQLRDVPSLGLSTDAECPKGELYLKGNSVFKGYFKNPEITKLVLGEDGWLRLGDAGILNRNGSISIIERIGEMKKLQNGYFIAPQKLENIYQTVPIINQIYVDVNSTYNFVIAIVHLDTEKLLQFAEVNGLEKDVKKLITMQEVEYAVLKQCERAAECKKLDSHEHIVSLYITSEEFSIVNKMLTKTHKLKRTEIKNHYN